MKLFVKNVRELCRQPGGCFYAVRRGLSCRRDCHQNEWLFLENNLFMKNFERNYNPNIRPLLKKIPVYIVRDYSISLYGAAKRRRHAHGQIMAG